MRTKITQRALSLLLLAAMLISMFGGVFASAVEVSEDELAPMAEDADAEEDISAEESGTSEEEAESGEEFSDSEAVSGESLPLPSEDTEPIEEDTDTETEPVAEAADAETEADNTQYVTSGYEAPFLFSDEVPEYFLDKSNWNVLDTSEPYFPATDLSEEELMADAAGDLTSASVMPSAMSSYDYAEELAKFPESYQVYLKELHKSHPNWIFVAVDTGLTWEEAIAGELGAASTIDYNLNSKTSHLLLNNHSGYYNSSAYSKTNGYKPIDGAHVSCSRAAIAYYMDPRNFLTEKYIFQFEDQSFSSVQQLSGVQSILKSADSSSTGLYKATTYVNTSGSTKTLASLNSDYGSDYSTIIYRAGMAAGVSPYYLASKIAQETGATTTNASICGTYSGYTGYYNFYNIGAYASTSGQAVANGLSYAKSHGWSNPILAIKGGADFLASSYIGKGQNTGYFMRFNVSPDATHSTFTHQYMSATYAVASEATSTLSGYKNANAVDSAFLFYIPVYANMPDQDSTVSLTATTKGKTSASVKLYNGPSTSESVLVTIPSGTTVTVLGGTVTSSDTYIYRLYYPYWYKVSATVSGKTYTGYVQEDQLTLNANYTLKPGATQSLSSIRSTSGNVGTILYETSNPDVATVSDRGVITAVSNGSCKIYAISTGGSFDAIGVTVSSSGSSGSNTVTSLDTPELTGISNADGSVKVTWASVEDATGYYVYRKTAGTSYSYVTAVTSNSYTDTNVSSGTKYTYTVKARNGSVASGYSDAGISVTYLSVPTLASASASSSGVTITWKAVPGASGYAVYCKNGGGWQMVDTTSSLSYLDREVESNKKYTYTVCAFNGNDYSSYNSTGVSAVTPSYTSLATPTLTSASNVDGGVKITWGSVTGASKYYIYRKTAGTSYAYIDTTTVASYTDKNVSSGTKYTYTVKAASGTVVSGYSSAGISVTYSPAAVTTLSTPVLSSAVNVDGGVKISWNIVSGAAKYHVYRKTAGTSYSYIATTTAFSYTDKSVSSGTKYTYTVKAASGSVVSGYSSAGISVTYSPAAVTTLSTPVLSSASNVDGGVKITWGSVSGASVYYIYRKTAGTAYSYLGSSTSVSYTDKSVSSGTKYTYTVKAGNGSVVSGYSNAGISVTYSPVAVTTLSTPVLSSASNVDGGVKISWNIVSGAAKYHVYRKTAGTSYSYIGTTTAVSYTDKSVSSGTKYTYTVKAANGSVVSGYSNEGVSVTYLATPALSSAVNVTGGVQVSWKSVSGATGYYIYRKTASTTYSYIGSSTSASYTDKSVSSGVIYTYTVKAKNSAAVSGYSNTGVSVAVSDNSSVTLVNYVTTGALNYRTGPGTSYDLAGTVSAGNTVKVVSGESYDVDGTTWYRVYINGSYYYMSSRYLTKA